MAPRQGLITPLALSASHAKAGIGWIGSCRGMSSSRSVRCNPRQDAYLGQGVRLEASCATTCARSEAELARPRTILARQRHPQGPAYRRPAHIPAAAAVSSRPLVLAATCSAPPDRATIAAWLVSGRPQPRTSAPWDRDTVRPAENRVANDTNGRRTAIDTSPGQAAGPGDACRPLPVAREGQLSAATPIGKKMRISEPSFIASCELLWLKPDGSEVTITARVGSPYQPDGQEYRCPVETIGLDGRYPDIGGKALCSRSASPFGCSLRGSTTY